MCLVYFTCTASGPINTGSRSPSQLGKCKFLMDIIVYPEYMIHPDRLDIALDTTNAIYGFAPKKILTYPNPFSFLYNIYCISIPNLAKIASLFDRKLKKGWPKTFEELTVNELDALSTRKEKYM